MKLLLFLCDSGAWSCDLRLQQIHKSEVKMINLYETDKLFRIPINVNENMVVRLVVCYLRRSLIYASICFMK